MDVYQTASSSFFITEVLQLQTRFCKIVLIDELELISNDVTPFIHELSWISFGVKEEIYQPD